jgi:hypothetical protein
VSLDIKKEDTSKKKKLNVALHLKGLIAKVGQQ